MAVAAVVVGALVAVQSRINAALAEQVGGGFVAATVSFATGLVVAAAVVLIRPTTRDAAARIPGLLRSGGLRWWQLLGGIGGAWLVATQGLVVVAVGVTMFTVGVVAGQVTGSLLVDRIGLSPAGRLPVTARRATAAVMALLAVILASTRPDGGAVSWSWIVLLAVSAGFGISVQQAVNGRVAAATHQPMVATLVNFLVGTVCLVMVTSGGVAAGAVSVGPWPTEAWLYLGGPIGVLFIALAAWAVRGVGVLVFGLLSIAGQLLGSVVADLVAPTGGAGLWPTLWVSVLLLAGAVVLAAMPAARLSGGTMGR